MDGRLRRTALALCAVSAGGLLTMGCQGPAPAPDGGALAGSAAAPEAAASARRPLRRYFVGHTSERCEVYSVLGDEISKPQAIPCPPDLLVGERIRLAGMTCFREGTLDEKRALPVVCPDPLTNAEKQDRAAP